jgi:Holliday junction resolvase RusA-like endonuclease
LERFEFVIEGPAVSLRAKESKAKRYQNWIKKVRAAAQEQWPETMLPIESNTITVAITNYYTLAPPDVDNIIKPILDGLETVVYSNDQQVYRVISEKLDRSNVDQIESAGVVLAAAIEKQYTELLHIVVTWNSED